MTLMILAHPNLAQSCANKTIAETLSQHLPDIEIRNIHQLYPDYKINVEQEQAALLRHDLIILQYPMYWFNMPAILKRWFDQVFAYKFAYGSGGDKLKGKKLLPSLTIGQPEQNFLKDGHNIIDNLLYPIKHSSIYVQMDYLEPVILYGMSTVARDAKEEIMAKVLKHSQHLQQKIIESDKL